MAYPTNAALYHKLGYADGCNPRGRPFVASTALAFQALNLLVTYSSAIADSL
jgi:hypothetical protein